MRSEKWGEISIFGGNYDFFCTRGVRGGVKSRRVKTGEGSSQYEIVLNYFYYFCGILHSCCAGTISS